MFFLRYYIHSIFCGLLLCIVLGCDSNTSPQREAPSKPATDLLDAFSTPLDMQNLDASIVELDARITPIDMYTEDMHTIEDMYPIEDMYEPNENEIRAHFRWEGEGFYRMPWPFDARLTAQGTPDLSDFPVNTPTLDKIKQYIQSSVYGFSLMPVIYMPFKDPLQENWLPSIEESTAIDSPIQLIDLSSESCNRRIGIEISISQVQDQYITDHVLQIRNAWGSMLTPGQPHALVILSTFGDDQRRIVRPREFQDAWQGEEHPTSASLQALKNCLPQLGIQAEDVALATVFTPQDPRQKLLTLHQYVTDPQQLDTRDVHHWRRSEGWSRRRLNFTTMTGLLPMPIFQQGNAPYEFEGGGIQLDDDGQAVIQRWEDVPVAVSFKEEGDFDPHNRPIIFFMSGTGWSQWTHLNYNWPIEAIEKGYLVYSFMPQFHGNRAGFTGSEMLATFNVSNPVAGATNFIQQTIETSYFIRAIQEKMIQLEGLPTQINTDRIMYGGHSQGALCGAIHAAISDQVAAYVLNAVSSSLTLTILHRNDVLNFKAVMSAFLHTSPQAFDLFHPGLQLMQLASDAIDPNSYAPYWKGWEGQPYGNHVFVINGQNDYTTHPLGMAHLSAVAQAHPLNLYNWMLPSYLLDQFMEVDVPVSHTHQNLMDMPLTIASELVFSTSHSTIYFFTRVRELAHEFWRSALMGIPHLKNVKEIYCKNLSDDDDDGLLDCDDPDCADDIVCGEIICFAGFDDDGDGLVDCDDPDCFDKRPCTEECDNERDDNGDDLIDCADPICRDANHCFENQCNNDEDDDGDGLIDCGDPDCVDHLACPESICDDGLDQNGNQMVDCDDLGCSWSNACRPVYEDLCDDGLDGDGDGFIDCDDFDCASEPSCNRMNDCWQVDLGSQTGMMLYEGYLDMMSNRYIPGDCSPLNSGEGSQDFAFLWSAPQTGTYQISTYGSELDTVLVIHAQPNESCQVDLELACNDDWSELTSSQIHYSATAEETLMFVVSPKYTQESDQVFRLHIIPESTP